MQNPIQVLEPWLKKDRQEPSLIAFWRIQARSTCALARCTSDADANRTEFVWSRAHQLMAREHVHKKESKHSWVEGHLQRFWAMIARLACLDTTIFYRFVTSTAATWAPWAPSMEFPKELETGAQEYKVPGPGIASKRRVELSRRTGSRLLKKEHGWHEMAGRHIAGQGERKQT